MTEACAGFRRLAQRGEEDAQIILDGGLGLVIPRLPGQFQSLIEVAFGILGIV